MWPKYVHPVDSKFFLLPLPFFSSKKDNAGYSQVACIWILKAFYSPDVCWKLSCTGRHQLTWCPLTGGGILLKKCGFTSKGRCWRASTVPQRLKENYNACMFGVQKNPYRKDLNTNILERITTIAAWKWKYRLLLCIFVIIWKGIQDPLLLKMCHMLAKSC